MYSSQTGKFPIITRIVGLFLIVYFLVAAFRGFFILIGEEIPIWISLLVPLLVTLIPGIFAVWLISLFPDIRIADRGVRFKYLDIFKGVINWDEIEGIYEVKSNWLFRGCIVLTISRKGYNFLTRKRLVLQASHGRLVNSEYPILLLSRGLKNRQEFIDQIMKNTGKTLVVV